MRYQPAVRIARPYYDDAGYIDALARSVTAALASLPEQPEVIVASYHGLPQKYADKGDPYPLHCAETTRLLREKLGLSEEKLIMTFQSRFGPTKWLQPYTDKTIAALGRKKVKRMLVITPAFSADCLETLEEIAIENAEIFKHNGGEQFTVVPCLNDSVDGMAVINAMVRRELQGWV